jgi:hypothetical protein
MLCVLAWPQQQASELQSAFASALLFVTLRWSVGLLRLCMLVAEKVATAQLHSSAVLLSPLHVSALQMFN